MIVIDRSVKVYLLYFCKSFFNIMKYPKRSIIKGRKGKDTVRESYKVKLEKSVN